MSEPLYRRLAIRRGVTAVIGSGGKTTLIARLCAQLPGSVLVCTSTRIYPVAGLPLLDWVSEPVAKSCCVGTGAEQGKLAAPKQSFEELAALADFVLVEADGARGLPLKAHAFHEPVIPACAGQVIQVVGLSGLGRPILEAHRSAVFAALSGCRETDPATAERVARVLNAEALADRYVLNQADDPERVALGEALAGLLSRPAEIVCLRNQKNRV